MSYFKLRPYMSMRSKILKQEVKLSSVVYPYEGFKSMGVKVSKLRKCVSYELKVRFVLRGNWASEASLTLGCSIEISRDIYIYVVGMSRMSN